MTSRKKKGRPSNNEPSESFDVTGVERKLLLYLEDLVTMQGFGNSKSAIARNFIWKEVNRLIEEKRLKQR
jgi:hypothetical protein